MEMYCDLSGQKPVRHTSISLIGHDADLKFYHRSSTHFVKNCTFVISADFANASY